MTIKSSEMLLNLSFQIKMPLKKDYFDREDTIITEDAILADTFNTFFSSGINENPNTSENNRENVLDINQIIAKFINHPSCFKNQGKCDLWN